MTTFEKVKVIIADQFLDDEMDIIMDSNFVEDLGADSLDIVELIMAFEEEFNIEIDECGTFIGKTVRSAVEYIDKEKND